MMNASPSNARFAGQVVLSRDPEKRKAFEDQVLDVLRERGYGETSAFAVRLALQEALNNAFIHGNRMDPEKTVTVLYDVDEQRVELEISDEGGGFDPARVPDPTADENITIPTGRGIMLMRAFMTSVEFIPPGNRVRITYRKPPDG